MWEASSIYAGNDDDGYDGWLNDVDGQKVKKNVFQSYCVVI